MLPFIELANGIKDSFGATSVVDTPIAIYKINVFDEKSLGSKFAILLNSKFFSMLNIPMDSRKVWLGDMYWILLKIWFYNVELPLKMHAFKHFCRI